MQDVFTYLLAKHVYLPRVPTRKYVFIAVRHAALQRVIRWWSRMQPMPTLEEIEIIERMLASDEPDPGA